MAYEAVHARPDGRSTVARLALTAREYGFAGIVVRNHGDEPAAYDPATIREQYDIDVVTGVEIRADDPARASGFVGTHRADQTVVLVHGQSPEINRFAVEQPAVDVLAHPMAGDGEFNHVLATEAADNGVRVEFNLRRALRAQGGERVRALRDLRKLREIVTACDTPYVVSADPRSHLHVRSPRALQAVGETVGFSTDEIETGLTEWRRLAERNRTRHSDAFVEPGVWRVEESDQNGQSPADTDDESQSSADRTDDDSTGK
jgi:ribonuclease P/MRP protein subunit RPP1